MSSGVFVDSTYEMEDGNIIAIRIQPETLALDIDGTNDPPVGAVSIGDLSAKVSGSRRSKGVNARTVTVQFTGAPPAGYAPGGTISLPVLTAAKFIEINKRQAGTYLGVAIRVAGKSSETVN